MFLIPEFSVHNHPKNLDVALQLNTLAFNDKGLRVSLIRFAGKVDNCRLICFKGRPAPPLPVERLINDCFDALAGAPRRWTCNLGCEVVNEGYRSAVAIGPPLY